MSSIELHPEKGLNPFLTYCPRCHGESREIVLVGRNDGVYVCPHCSQQFIGKPNPADTCPKCKAWVGSWTRTRTLEERERLPGCLCEACEKEEKEHRAIVEAGGVYWKCADCKKQGVIKSNAPFAKMIREHMKIAAPQPCGVEFSKKDCPACGPNPVAPA